MLIILKKHHLTETRENEHSTLLGILVARAKKWTSWLLLPRYNPNVVVIVGPGLTGLPA